MTVENNTQQSFARPILLDRAVAIYQISSIDRLRMRREAVALRGRTSERMSTR